RQPLVDELLSRTVGLHMHQDAIGRLSLTAVARHRVAVVEMALIAAIQGDRPARVEAHPYVAGGLDLFNRPKFMVRDVPLTIRRRELDAVATGKRAILFSIERHALHAFWIVGDPNGLGITRAAGARHRTDANQGARPREPRPARRDRSALARLAT